MSEYGIIVSKPGYDVRSPDPRTWALHTKYPFLQAEEEFTGKIPADFPPPEIPINHDLGYKPVAILYIGSNVGTDNERWSIRYGYTPGISILLPDSDYSLVLTPGALEAGVTVLDYYIFALTDDIGF